jgi:CheY-like chemotaxis protein
MAANRILLVEDDPGSRRALAEVLREEGYDVLDVPSGHAALYEAPRWEPEAAVIDVGLPDLDGFTVMHELTKLVPNCHLITVSGSADLVLEDGILKLRDVEQKALGEGARVHLPKPLDVRRLIEIFEQILTD